jgi:hypothetical protein
MLAYVFWHWPATGIAPAEYERMQRAFHQALAEAGVAGFRGSTSFRLDGRRRGWADRPPTRTGIWWTGRRCWTR